MNTSFSRPISFEPVLSPEEKERTRKNLSAILKNLSSVGQVHVAEAIGVHESNVSKMKDNGEFERFAAILAKVGLKVVPESYRCIDPKTLESILHGHRMWLAGIESPDQLTWE